MADTYVLWTPYPRSEAGPDALDAAAPAVGSYLPRWTVRRSLPLARAARDARRTRAFRPYGPLPWQVRCPVRVTAEKEVLVAEQDLVDAARLAAAVPAGTGLVLALTPPPVLLEHVWREAVWQGGTVRLDDLLRDGHRRVRAAYDRLFDAVSPVRRREVVTTCACRAEDLTPTRDPAWRLSVRGVEALRRMNGDAPDAAERARMREFCLRTYPRAAEPEAAVTVHHVMVRPDEPVVRQPG